MPERTLNVDQFFSRKYRLKIFMFTLKLLDIHLQSLHDLVVPMICLIGKVFVDFRRLHKISFVFYYILCYIEFKSIDI